MVVSLLPGEEGSALVDQKREVVAAAAGVVFRGGQELGRVLDVRQLVQLVLGFLLLGASHFEEAAGVARRLLVCSVQSGVSTAAALASLFQRDVASALCGVVGGPVQLDIVIDPGLLILQELLQGFDISLTFILGSGCDGSSPLHLAFVE